MIINKYISVFIYRIEIYLNIYISNNIYLFIII